VEISQLVKLQTVTKQYTIHEPCFVVLLCPMRNGVSLFF